MNKLKQQLEELKLMQKKPKFYLANYFVDLRAQVDLELTFKKDQNEKYMQIIQEIQSFESACLKLTKTIYDFDEEIQIIEHQLVEEVIQENQIAAKIDFIEKKIEKVSFSNKTILFLNNYGKDKQSFLLIINDEYLRKKDINDFIKDHIEPDIINFAKYVNRYGYDNSDSESEWESNDDDDDDDDNGKTKIIMAKEKLMIYFLFKKLSLIKITPNVINLEISLINMKEIDFSGQNINELIPSTFNGLVNLNNINFSENKIKILHEKTFFGLTSLKSMNFSFNRLRKIHESTFNGLISLDYIDFRCNQLVEIHPSTFNGLLNLQSIVFASNHIEKVHEQTFSGLKNLYSICFSFNKIKEIHPSTFKGLKKLSQIVFSMNQIKEICLDMFDDLPSITHIHISEEYTFDYGKKKLFKKY